MKGFISILKNRIFLGLLGVVALSLIIWFGADFLESRDAETTISTTIRLLLMLTVLLVWLLSQLFLMWWEHKKNKDMLTEMEEDPADLEAAKVDQEVKALGKRFNEGMAILKKAKFETSKGKVPLYQLPWYIIIGPPGAGKTTALVNSGLDFPLAESHGKSALGGVGGTRNCDWWFTNEAVLIDTAGRYTTQDSHAAVDSSAWQGFLKLLKKHRPRRPVNGAIIAISAQDLLTQQAAQRTYNAKLIRERVNELQQQFGVRFPIYVMITKCDLVAGFSEFFANLTQPERQQMWGVTFDHTSSQPLAGLSQEIDQLIGRLNDRLLWRVNSERDPAKRALIQAFPQQIENLKPLLEAFMNETFSPSRYNEAPFLRGVYLCSGTQEGTPIDRMMAAVSSSFGLSRAALPAQSGGKSFFINRLFRDVIVPEAELVGSNKKLENLMLWMRRGYFVGLGALVLVLVVVWSVTLSRNNASMQQVNQLTAQYQAEKNNLGKFNLDVLATLPVLNPLRDASKVYNQTEHPFLVGLGLYDASVDKAADALYLEALRKEFLPRFQFMVEQKLDAMSASDDQLIETFRVYLMLSGDHFDKRDIENWAKKEWQATLQGEATKQEDLRNHLALILKQGATSLPLKQRVVDASRGKLRQISAPQRLFSQLKSGDLGREQMDLYAQIGGRGAAAFGYAQTAPAMQIPALYSKPGYDSLDFSAKSPLLTQLDRDRWIFGSKEMDDFTEADKEALAKQVETLYLNDYTFQWQNFLNNLTVQKFSNMSEATETLKMFYDPGFSPIMALLRLTKENTALTPGWPTPTLLPGTSKKAAGAAQAIFDKVVEPTSVDVAFREINQLTTQSETQPAAVNDILAAVKELHNYLNDMAVAPNPSTAAFTAAKARFAGNSADPIRKMRVMASNTPKPVSDWLNQLADHSWSVILQNAKIHLNSAWKQQVYDVYSRGLANRYPMRRVNSEALLDDFNQYFSAAGIENTFVQQNIKPFVDRNFKPKQIEGQSIAFNSNSLAQLRNATVVRQAFFKQSADTPGYAFKLQPVSLDTSVGKFELTLGKQRNTYTHGPKIPKSFSWKVDRDTSARILFEDLNQTVHRENFSGPWAWYRLLDASGIRKVGNTTYRATFSKNGRKADYKLTSSSRISGLNLAILRNYDCPETL